MKDLLFDQSHRRYNFLTGEWVQVSPHRTKRPWQGQQEKVVEAKRPKHDPNCYLCPGNERASGEKNPPYESTYAFVNDFAALQNDIEDIKLEDGLLQAKSEKGICKVICFSPRHDLTIAEMARTQIEQVVELWVNEFTSLSKIENINYIQLFENKGSAMGCSNPHPHGQIWAQESIPVEVVKKSEKQLEYFQKTSKSLLREYLKQELEDGERILFENYHMVVLVPFWAVWPFECMIIPKRQSQDIAELSKDEKIAFAEAIKWLTIKYDNLFETSCPYSAGIHQAPTDGKDYPEWHWHMSFYPPLLRSATVKKFMVGYEMFANPQRDITAEQAAESLRLLSDIHYKERTV